MNQCSR